MTPEKEKTVLDNMNLVHHVLSKDYPSISVSSDIYDDCYQEGCLGLCLAAERFNPDRGSAFSSYAYKYISTKIRTYLRNNNLIKVPRSVIDRNAKIFKIASLGYDCKDIKEILKISDMQYFDATNFRNVASLDAPIQCHSLDGDTDEILLGDIVGYVEEDSGEELLTFICKTVDEILVRASDTGKKIYREYLYTKLISDVVPKQNILAEKYGVTQATVSRIIKKYDDRLREIVKEKIDNDNS